MKPAYVVMIREKMRNADTFQEYGRLARSARLEEGMTPLAFYGAVETLEGAEADGIVILRFSDLAQAKAWYESAEYTKARTVRYQAADYRVILVEGIAGSVSV